MVGGASTDTHNLPAALPVREFPIYASDIIFDLNTFYSSSPLPICHRIVISKERRTLPSLSKSWNNARELSRILPWARRDFSNEKVNEWRGKPIFPGSIYFSIIFGGLQDGARLVRASYKLPSPPTYATEWCNHVTTLYAICHWVCACVIPSTPTSSYSVSQQLPTDQTLLGYNDWRKWLMGYDDSRLNIVKSDYPGSPLGFMIQVSVNPGSPSGIGRDYPWRS